jgi:hypothetical protein
MLTEPYGQYIQNSTRTNHTGDNAMFTKIGFGLAIILATVSGSLAATKIQSTGPSQNVYNPSGAYAGSDPDPSIRFELRRDWGRGQ